MEFNQCRIITALIFLIMLVFFTNFTQAENFLPTTQIISEKFIFQLNGQISPIAIQASDPAIITSVRCYFRFNNEMPFLFVEMLPSKEDYYQATLPQVKENIRSVEYFFLLMNGNQQVIRTASKIQERQTQLTPAQAQGLPPTATIKTELQNVATNLSDFFIQPIDSIQRVSQKKAYGYIAGVYQAEEMQEGKIYPGFFGAFLWREDKTFQPLPGVIVTAQDRQPKNLSSTSTSKESTKVTGPDIQGENWSGKFYLYPDITQEEKITAVITQDPLGFVTITTSKVSGIGKHLRGQIFTTGHMLLYDDYDGEDWTTFYGPASKEEILIADWVDKSYQALYQIHLTRDKTQPPEEKKSNILNLFIQGILPSISKQ